MIKLKAWNASNSTAIAKFHNAEIDYFGHKMFGHDLIRGSLATDLPIMLHQFKIEQTNFQADVVYLLCEVDYLLRLAVPFCLNFRFTNRLSRLRVDFNSSRIFIATLFINFNQPGRYLCIILLSA